LAKEMRRRGGKRRKKPKKLSVGNEKCSSVVSKGGRAGLKGPKAGEKRTHKDSSLKTGKAAEKERK